MLKESFRKIARQLHKKIMRIRRHNLNTDHPDRYPLGHSVTPDRQFAAVLLP